MYRKIGSSTRVGGVVELICFGVIFRACVRGRNICTVQYIKRLWGAHTCVCVPIRGSLHTAYLII